MMTFLLGLGLGIFIGTVIAAVFLAFLAGARSPNLSKDP
jgi:hypothetical protein